MQGSDVHLLIEDLACAASFGSAMVHFWLLIRLSICNLDFHWRFCDVFWAYFSWFRWIVWCLLFNRLWRLVWCSLFDRLWWRIRRRLFNRLRCGLRCLLLDRLRCGVRQIDIDDGRLITYLAVKATASDELDISLVHS